MSKIFYVTSKFSIQTKTNTKKGITGNKQANSWHNGIRSKCK